MWLLKQNKTENNVGENEEIGTLAAAGTNVQCTATVEKSLVFPSNS